jgi:hypothetical protein
MSPATLHATSSTKPRGAEHDALSWVLKEGLIDGGWRPAEGGGRISVEDPATGEALCTSRTPPRPTARRPLPPRRPPGRRGAG